MDPVLQKAKQRHHEKKSHRLTIDLKGTEAQREFRTKLAKNVHAHALATNVRFCQVTRARLPSHFLIPFTAEMPTLDDAAEPDHSNSVSPQRPDMVQSIAKRPALTPAIECRSTGSPSSYHLATKEAFDHTFSKKGRSQVLVNERMKKRYSAHIGHTLEKASADWLDKTRRAWPAEQSTPDKVLVTLRRTVVNKLAWCANQEEESIPGGSLMCQTALGDVDFVVEDSLKERQRAIVQLHLLYVKHSSSYYNVAGEQVGRPRDEVEEVEYNLLHLLGPELCEKLKEKHLGEWRGGRAPILLRHEKSVKTIMALEKLQNYLDGGKE
ncbi:hypothetical protein DOTSEDRAFT_82858 [Dothistroma septosporum NZE10]|uniref:Uncharacterized protein n=1 Tax=Dothistroma septosporum (strain NZE10 / CBS 128990) TaxID=675120 RepID=N1PD31_DOTSN|nr:hypothetical protein DOTSEDRAFT_82858 [Dothistroma septosporum NZE10]